MQQLAEDTHSVSSSSTTSPTQKLLLTPTSGLTATDENRQTSVARISSTRTAMVELTACARNLTATVYALTPSPTPRKLTKTSTPAPTFTHAPLIEFPPYSEKEVLLIYSYDGGDVTLVDIFSETRSYTRLVLYVDGQLIISKPGGAITTIILSESQVEQLLAQIDQKGFYAIETNQHNDNTDPLYNFGDNYQELHSYHGVSACLAVNGPNPRKLCFYRPYWEYLVPQAKDLFQYLEDYMPGGMELYQPDRLILIVSKGYAGDGYTDQDTVRIPWPTDLPSLETRGNDMKYMGFYNQDASHIYHLVENWWGPKIFIDDEQDYVVFSWVVMPHEHLLQP